MAGSRSPRWGVQSVCKGDEGHNSAICLFRYVCMVQVRAEVHRVWERTLREPYLSVKVAKNLDVGDAKWFFATQDGR